MPLFEFIDNNTNEVFEKLISNADKEVFLEKNPHIKQLLDAPLISMDSTRFMGVKKVDQGWKDVLRKINSRAPGSDLNNNSTIGF